MLVDKVEGSGVFLMAFNPFHPFVLTSSISGGVGGNGSVVTIRREGVECVVTSNLFPQNPPVVLSKRNAQMLDSALKSINLSSPPVDDGSAGYDLSIWSVVLVQGSAEWRFSIRADRVTHSPFGGLYASLNAIMADIKSIS